MTELTATYPGSGGGLPCSDAQVKAIWAIGRMQDIGPDEICTMLYDRYATSSPLALTRKQASEFIDVLKAGVVKDRS